MGGCHHDADNAHLDREPVEQTDIAAHPEIRKEGHVKLSALLERNSPDHVPKGRPEKKSQNTLDTGNTKSQNDYHIGSLMWPPTSRLKTTATIEAGDGDPPAALARSACGVASPLQLRQFGAGLGCGDDKHWFAVKRNERLESSL